MINPLSWEIIEKSWTVFADDPEHYEEIQQAVRIAADLYARGILRIHARADGSRRAIDRAVRAHLNAKSTKLVAVILGAFGRKKLTWQEASDQVPSVCFWKPCGEAVGIRIEPKSSGGHRGITIPGPMRRGYERVGLDIVIALCPQPQFEFAVQGRGAPRAVKEIVKHVNGGAGDYLVAYDVKNFFPSVTNGHLNGLMPLSPGLRACLFFIEEGAQANIIHSHGLSGKELHRVVETALQGLPQGSLASPYVASLVMQSLVKDLPADVPVVVHVDDGVIIAGDRGTAKAIEKALVHRAKALPGGPVFYKRIEIVHLKGTRTLDILGYRIKRGFQGQARATPQPVLIDKFIARLKAAMKDIHPDDYWDHAQKAGVQWAKSQSAWDYLEPSEDIFMMQVEIVAQEALSNFNYKNMKKPKISNPVYDLLMKKKAA